MFVSGAVCTDDVQGVELCTQVVADEHKVDFQVHKVVADVHKVQVARWQGGKVRGFDGLGGELRLPPAATNLPHSGLWTDGRQEAKS